MALDLSPLIAEKDIDFGIDTEPVWVQAHEWMLGELAGALSLQNRWAQGKVIGLDATVQLPLVQNTA